MSESPVFITPSTLVTGKEQLVIVEFPQDIPQDGLLTLNIYHSGKKLSTVPAVTLGTHTLKAKFPEFTKQGEVEVIVHINREEHRRIPRFRVLIQSPLEAIFSSALLDRGVNRKALLASAVAFLSHCDEKNKELSGQADRLLLEMVQNMHAFELSNWSIGALLTGKHGPEENLLHFCTRRNLIHTAEHLLVAMPNSQKLEYLSQRGSDNKTPVELAHKNEMRQFEEIAEHMMVQNVTTASSKKATPKSKRKGKVEKSRSMESNMSHLLLPPGSPDLSQSGTYSSPEHKKKSKAAKVFSKLGGKKDKGMVVSTPQQPFVNEFGEPMIAPTTGSHSPTLPISRSMEPIDRAATWSERYEPYSEGSYHLAGSYSPQPSSPLLSVRHELPTRTHPRNERPSSRTESIGSSSSSFEQGDPRMRQIGVPRPVSCSLSGASDPGTALSNAIQELKAKALYLAKVIREYSWVSVSQGDHDCVLKVDDRVYVTQEGVEGDPLMCLGVWKGRYGKLPLSIFNRLPQAELDQLRADLDREDISDGDSDYEKVPDEIIDGWGAEEEDVYKVPRNVPAPSYLAGSDSEEDDQPVYDVPPRRSINGDSITATAFDMTSSPYIKGSDSDEDPVYDVPPNRHQSPSPGPDHNYINFSRGDFPPSVAALLAAGKLTDQRSDTNRPAGAADRRESADTHRTRPDPLPEHSKTVISTQDTQFEPSEDSSTKAKGEMTKSRSHTLPVISTSRPVPDEESGHVYDDLDSTLSVVATMMADIGAIYDDTIPTQQAPNQHTPATVDQGPTAIYDDTVPKQTTTRSVDQSTLASSKGDVYPEDDPYSTLEPKRRSTTFPRDRVGYDEITAVKNMIQGDGEMVVRRSSQQADNDDVFQPPNVSPTPTPKKRTRLPTTPAQKTTPAPAQKVSPKPKPRRLTTPLNSEGRESSSVSDILASSEKRGEVRVEPKLEMPKSSYVNIEMRVKHKKPPPPPNMRKRSSNSTSNPGVLKKPVPPVAPKPKKQ